MVGPLASHALLARHALGTTRHQQGTLRRYTTVRTAGGDASQVLAEERPLNPLSEVTAVDKARLGLASNERMYQALASQAGQLPEVPTEWRLDLGDGAELPIERVIHLQGIYLGLVLTRGGAP